MVNNLVQQKFNLESAEETSAVFETLSMATATSREYMNQHGAEHESMADELKEELAQQEEDRARVNDIFVQDDGDNEELLRELEALSIAEKVGNDDARVLEEIQR